MKIKEIFKNYNGKDIEISGIATNSKLVKPGDLFVCIKGANFDRHEFIEDSASLGAVAAVVSKEIDTSIPTIKVEDCDLELVRILKVFYNNPLNKLKLIGITGTDGKTTTAKVVQQLIGKDKCGFIGTLGADCEGFKYKTNNTTPPIETLYYIFNKFVELGIKYVSMEASSEAYFYHRLDSIKFDIGALTNITSEHLNTHKTLENYIECKKQLFKNSNKQILNSSDLHFEEVKEISKDFVTYGKNDEDLLKVNSYTLFPDHTTINLTIDGKSYEIYSSLLGKFNVENVALAICVTNTLGLDLNETVERCRNLVIPGRMQVMDFGQDFFCICDYAHTANAVKNALEFARSLNLNKIITVIGQAGGRDQFKRKVVGKTTLDLSDFAILTSDDPRFEDVNDIIKMMLEDTDKTNYEIMLDRSLAIEKAIMMANNNDIIMCLGKGVDPYQKIEDKDVYYLETEEIEKAIKKKLNSK